MGIMDAASNIRRIALYGPFGWGNLGDASIQEAMMHNVRLRLRTVEFLGISLNPDNTEAIHGIPSIPILRTWTSRSQRSTQQGPSRATPPVAGAGAGIKARLAGIHVLRPILRTLKRWAEPAREFLREVRFLARSVSILRRVDVFVVSGGGQISDDWGGPWDHPYSLLKWMLCARLAKARVYVVSVGAGPIRRPLSGFLFRAALRLAHYRSYRDSGSLALVAPFGFTRRDDVYPDLAFSLPTGLAPPGTDPGHRPLVIGLSPMAYCYPKAGPWPEQDRARYVRYLGVLSQITASLLAAGDSVSILLSQIRNDRYALDDLARALATQAPDASSARLRVEPTESLPHLLAQIAHTDLVITSRLHGVILSYLLHKPVIALSYDPKIRAVMEQFGQTAYCLDLESATAELLGTRMASLRSERGAVTDRIGETLAEHRSQLQQQYDRLFGPRAASPRCEDGTDDLSARASGSSDPQLEAGLQQHSTPQIHAAGH